MRCWIRALNTGSVGRPVIGWLMLLLHNKIPFFSWGGGQVYYQENRHRCFFFFFFPPASSGQQLLLRLCCRHIHRAAGSTIKHSWETEGQSVKDRLDSGIQNECNALTEVNETHLACTTNSRFCGRLAGSWTETSCTPVSGCSDTSCLWNVNKNRM